jgi:hypothetical protein
MYADFFNESQTDIRIRIIMIISRKPLIVLKNFFLY